ncbi:dihydrodipicolinate synthase family protein [Poriferisphaera sp. WC338]|uniref:dihydrodipicolinate synthase family protein n=1 Tax=Poriferisphaera sp. WC338 TaxID=3425129 RepID=UPI003D81717B
MNTYHGIIPPVITPLKDTETLDVDGLEKLLEHILAGGVHGIFMLGTTGEAPSLPYQLRREVIQHANRIINKRVPLLVGITDTVFGESVNLAKFAADNGTDAVVLAPPYYFAAGEPELYQYTDKIASALPLPLFLYNMPSCTKLSFTVDMVRKLMDHPNIVGLKDSSANVLYLNLIQLFAASREDFTTLVGPEELLAQSMLAGANGGVNGGANLFPRLYVDLYNATLANNIEQTELLHNHVMHISSNLYSIGNHSSAFLKSIKCALSVKGICSGTLAEPFSEFAAPERKRVEQFLEQFSYTADV